VGITELITSLQADFNGDFLSSVNERKALWVDLNDHSLDLLRDFLSNVDLETGQTL